MSSWSQIFNSPLLHAIAVLVANYALGCIATGYYLVRIWLGKDLRQLGSGSTGARNVGRQIGKLGFMITFMGDLIKGGLAVWGTRQVTSNEWLAAMALLAVIGGHIWPVQLRFRGGKGMAPAAAAILLFSPLHFGVLSALALLALAWTKRTIFSGLAAFAVGPFVTIWLGPPRAALAGVSAASVLVLLGHRQNILEELAAMDSNRKLNAN